jgi:hypothetical protein
VTAGYVGSGFSRTLQTLTLTIGLATVAAPALAQDTHVIVITGVAGSPEYAARFQKWAARILDASAKLGVLPANLTYVSGNPDQDAVRKPERSTREAVSQALASAAARAKPDDEVFVILIGHGSYDGRVAAFNLPGPDLSAGDYATLLSRFGQTRVVFVNTASSSGGFLEPLAGPGRTVVTATRTGGERNDTRFPEFFVEAIEGTAADTDRNGRVSIAEAFEFARTKVATSYEQSGHIPTEHPALDDSADGKLAEMQFLAPPRSRSAEMASASPALRALVTERDALEQKIAGLRLRKDAMPAAEYEEQLETLLIDLTLKSRQIEELEKRPDP